MKKPTNFIWEKLGRVFVPSVTNSPHWMVEFAQAPNALVLEDRIRVYFTTRPPRDEAGQYVSQVAFIDVKREDPLQIISISETPVIELGEPGCFDEHGTYPFSVVKVGSRLTAIFGGWSRCSSVPFDVSLGIAEANDSDLVFSKLGKGPILTKSLHEPFIISSPKIRFFDGKFYLFYIAGSSWVVDGDIDPVYSIRLAISQDGIKWEKLNRPLISNVLGEHEAQASPDVFYFEGRYHMLFCYRHGSNFRNSDRGYRIGHAYSEDLLNWIRDDSLSSLGPSNSGWDSSDVSYPNVVQVDNFLYCFYLGNEVGKTGFGVARMRIT